ncbi:hypothetical protein BCR44DRAFT_60028 [Catenaria anguillulae PL171]|uniref:F-box domain-containing protein n=1 Tax=Catenaria anguillulae PL171 TaxID=765915 RepID=A0A1Y2HYS0_9FUNG|nr:hypothetical protein BCR44DRAFT_60028 [Catenaria anguillulae PL171]
MHTLHRILSSLSIVETADSAEEHPPSSPATATAPAHADCQEPSSAPTPANVAEARAPITLKALPAAVLERIGTYLRFDPDRTMLAGNQATLAALAKTCRHICNAITPILYKAPILNRLQALTLLESLLNDRPDLAARVQRLVLAPSFADMASLDLIGLIIPAKWRSKGSVPSIALFEEQGPTAARMLLTSWMTHFATLCAELRHIDWSLATDMPPQYAFGFTNLATLLRERRGSFRAPAHVDWPVSCIRATDPGHPRKSVVYFVNSLDYANRTLDIHNVTDARHLMTYNLAPIDDLIVGGPAEMKKWKIRNVDLVDQHQFDPFNVFESQLPMPPLEAFGLSLHGHIFELNKQRMSPSSSALGTTVFVSTCGPCAVHDLLKRRGYSASQCTGLKLSLPQHNLPVDKEQEPMLVRLMQNIFSMDSKGLDRMCSLPLVNVRSLTLGTPFFAFATSAESLKSLHKFSTALPNLESLVIHSACTSIGDILISLDPLLRRPANRVKELTIMRTSSHPARRELTCPPALPPKSTFSKNSNLRLDQATPGHLRQLILFDPKPTETIAIHPGLLLGIERLNVRGVCLLVAPPHLASATSASFPYHTLPGNPSGRHPNLFTSMPLPNLRSLAMDADRELAAAADDPDIDNLDQLLPTCPQLESLVLSATRQEYFTRAGFVLDVMDKYAASLRNVAIMQTVLSDAELDKLGTLLAKRTDAWRVRRVMLVNRKPLRANDDDKPFVDRLEAGGFDKERVMMFGDLATTCVSHVLVPADRAASSTLTMRPPSTLSRHPGYVKHEQMVRNKGSRPGTACVCGKMVMGKKKSDLGTKVWITPTGLDVVCAECVEGKVKPVRVWDLSGQEGGGRIEMRQAKHLTPGDVGKSMHVDFSVHMAHGVWGVGERSVLCAVTWLE